jgi:hypothetical protein
VICFLGGAADVLASTFGLSVNAILWTFRVAVLAVPPLVGWFTYRLCKELSARDGVPIASPVTVREIPGRLRRGPPTEVAETAEVAEPRAADAEADAAAGPRAD